MDRALDTARLVTGELSAVQQQLWSVEERCRTKGLLNLAGLARVNNLPLDWRRVPESLAKVIQDQAALRTVFHVSEEDGAPVAVVLPEIQVPVPVYHFDDPELSDEERLDEAVRTAHQISTLPFDLRSGPLVRAAVLVLSDSDFLVLVVAHHLVADALSISILNRHAMTGESTPPAMSYLDWTVDQRRRVAAGEFEREAAYWREVLRDAPTDRGFPVDHPPGDDDSTDAVFYSQVIDLELSERVRALSRRLKTTPYLVLLGGYLATLSAWSGSRDITVATSTLGRYDPALTNLIGMLVNYVPLRFDVVPEARFESIVDRARTVLFEALDHSAPPLPLLDLPDPVARTLFNMPAVADPFNMMLPPPVLPQASTFPLSVYLLDLDDRYELRWRYLPRCYEPATVAAIAESYRRVVDAATATPDTSLATLLEACRDRS